MERSLFTVNRLDHRSNLVTRIDATRRASASARPCTLPYRRLGRPSRPHALWRTRPGVRHWEHTIRDDRDFAAHILPSLAAHSATTRRRCALPDGPPFATDPLFFPGESRVHRSTRTSLWSVVSYCNCLISSGFARRGCRCFVAEIRRDEAASAGDYAAGELGPVNRRPTAGGAAAGRGAKGVLVSVPSTAVFSRSRPRDRCERTAPTEVPMLCAASA